jgi:hypothetical protein
MRDPYNIQEKVMKKVLLVACVLALVGCGREKAPEGETDALTACRVYGCDLDTQYDGTKLEGLMRQLCYEDCAKKWAPGDRIPKELR